jgi:ElaB/YqjD/DUF883 family membrane-anchored ribosome-binding protein
MAEQAVTTPRQPKRRRSPARATTRRRAANGNGPRRRRAASASNLSQLEQLIRNLEARVSELTSGSGIRSNVRQASSQVGNLMSGATHQVGEAVADTLTEVADKFRNGAHSVTSMARLGTGALHKITDEVEKRPFMTVAIALGIGFLAGLAGKAGELSGDGRRH